MFSRRKGEKRQSLKGSGMCRDRSFGDRYLRGSIRIYQKMDISKIYKKKLKHRSVLPKGEHVFI